MRFLPAFLVLALIPRFALAQGGPPVATDDPGTPGEGRWEINISGITQTGHGDEAFEAPYFDINYGLGDHIQLKFETGWAYEHSAGEDHRGMGTALAGVKMRFIDEEHAGFSMSVYPQYEFHHFLTSADPDLSGPGRRVVLPFELAKHFGKFGVDTEVGRQFISGDNDQWFYGLVLSWQPIKKLDLLLDGHGDAKVGVADTDFFYLVGTRVEMSEKATLLVSVGHTTRTFANESPRLLTYLGLQLKL